MLGGELGERASRNDNLCRLFNYISPNTLHAYPMLLLEGDSWKQTATEAVASLVKHGLLTKPTELSTTESGLIMQDLIAVVNGKWVIIGFHSDCADITTIFHDDPIIVDKGFAKNLV